MSAIVALCNFTALRAEDARENDPVAVTKSYWEAMGTGNVDAVMALYASDAVVVTNTGAKLTGEEALRKLFGRLKGLQTRDYELRLDGDRVIAHGKTYGFVPYIELGVEPGEWDGSLVVRNGRIVYMEWHYTPEFNAKLERACLQRPDYLLGGGVPCLDFSARVKAYTESAGRK